MRNPMRLAGIIIILVFIMNCAVFAENVPATGKEKVSDSGKGALTPQSRPDYPAKHPAKTTEKTTATPGQKSAKDDIKPAKSEPVTGNPAISGSEPHRKSTTDKPSAKGSEPPDNKPKGTTTPGQKSPAEGADSKVAGQESSKQGSEPAKKTTPVPADKSAAAGSEPAKETTESKKDAGKNKTPTQKEKDEKLASWIERTVEFGIQKDRRDAINRMLTIKDPEVHARMGKCLITVLKNDTDAEILVKALSVTGEMKVTEAADAIMPHINNESEDVRLAAVTALREIKAESKKPELIKKLKEQDTSVDSNVTEALIQALGDFKANELAPWAQEHISNIKTSKIIRAALVLFLGKAGSAADKDFLVKLYRDENEELNIRSYAVNSISKLGLKEASPDIRQVLSEIDAYPFKKKKTYYNLYLYSIVALVKLGDTEAVPRLMDAMKSNNTGVRVKAIELIKEFNDKRTIDILQYKMKYDPEPKVRSAARKALKELGVEVKDEEKEIPGPEGEEEKGKKNDES